MIATGNLCPPEGLQALIREAMETDNQLALDLAYSMHVWRDQADALFPTGRATMLSFPKEDA